MWFTGDYAFRDVHNAGNVSELHKIATGTMVIVAVYHHSGSWCILQVIPVANLYQGELETILLEASQEVVYADVCQIFLICDN